MRRFSRQEICQKFDARIAANEPILVCESGAGITAKLTAKYGIDMILVLSASAFRMRGLDDVFAGKPYGNGNDMTMQMVTDMRLVVGDEVPVIAGVCPNDPYRFVDDYIARYKCGSYAEAPCLRKTDYPRRLLRLSDHSIYSVLCQ